MNSSEPLFNGQVMDVQRVPTILPDGRQEPWEIASYPDNLTAICVLGYCKELDSIILVENYRPSLGRWNLEIAGGLPSKDESLENAAKREFEEETGWIVNSLKYVKTFYELPGCGNFPTSFYIAESSETLEQKLDRNEFVRVRLIKRDAVIDLINDDMISEPVTLCVLQTYLNKNL